MTVLHLACASNFAYAPHCAAMLHSVLAHRGGLDVQIHYLHGPSFPAQAQDALRAMVERNGGSISFFSIPDDRIEQLPSNLHLSREVWYRIYLPSLLPDVDRVLYLDADTIVTDSLEDLWQTDVTGRYVAAVTNVFGTWDLHYPGTLGLPGPSAYFNTGVLLMNLEEMRRDDCTDALRDYAIEHGPALWFCDQDAINVVLGPRRLALHPRWNCTNGLLIFSTSHDVFDADAVAEARRNPAIRHFEGGGANKPWHYLCDHSMRELYFEHRRATPWPHVKLEGVTPRNVLTRLGRGLRRGADRRSARGPDGPSPPDRGGTNR